MTLTLGSLFDGIGGWQLAAKHAGVEPLWSSEIEPFPCAVTAKHFPDTLQIGDITKIDGERLWPVDIICAGSPCQDLSVAGKQEGLKGERSGLFRDAIRLVRYMRRASGGRYPRFFVWENVPGAFSSNGGMDFRAVLEEITEAEIPMPENNKWADTGMVEWDGGSLAWRILDAQYWGVPQRRKRIFLVADFANGCAGEILFEPKSLSGNIAESQGAGKETAGAAGKSVDSASGSIVYSFDSLASNSMKSKNPHSGCHITNIAKTLDTSIPDPSKNQGDIAIYDMTHANEVIRTVNGDKTNTLNSRMGTGGNQVPVVAFKETGFGTFRKDTVAGTQKESGGGMGGGSETLIYRKAVRRLTPTECERLQGLEDGYTLIDDKTCSDTARYKALGNGMAQPCADYVIKRIVEVAGNDS